MDWGFGAPFSVGWWWVDNDGRIYRFAEWYGWNGVTANVGLRLTDRAIGEGVLERERAMGIGDRAIMRVAGPDCFNRKPSYMGGGQGPATADEWRALNTDTRLRERYGYKYDLRMRPGDPKRELKIRQFRNRLAIPADTNVLPMLVVYNTCRDFIRIIPSLCTDEKTGEYLEEGQELHPFDEACHICMQMPLDVVTTETLAEAAAVRAKQAIRDTLDAASRGAMDEIDKIVAGMRAEQEEDMDWALAIGDTAWASGEAAGRGGIPI
jgi:hypothetical protein